MQRKTQKKGLETGVFAKLNLKEPIDANSADFEGWASHLILYIYAYFRTNF